MATYLVDLLREQQSALEEGLADDLRWAEAPHYRMADPELVHQRCVCLVEALIESAGGDPTPFVSYVRRISVERIAEGFCLGEIQHALSSLESRVWHVLVEGSSIGSLVRDLSLITRTIGRAKDELACLYLQQKQVADRTIAVLEQRLAELSKGTDAHVEPEN